MSESNYDESQQAYFKPKGLHHGGRILAAVEKYNIAQEHWLDLSTGLNPNAWQVPSIPDELWQALPEESDGLQAAACQYYGCDACLPVAGSQAAIQTLPTLRSYSKVGVISPTYAEHEYNWRQAGHDVIPLSFDEVEQQIYDLDVLVVINPNNPTGHAIRAEQLLDWHQKLASRGGWLIVDEAFMDITPEKSLVSTGIKPGLIILRSIGKFFGLAGIRCGFVISDNEMLQRLSQKLGPWTLTGVTRFIATQALLDKAWQDDSKKSIIESSKRLNNMLSQAGLMPNGGTALFQWLEHEQANDLYQAFAEKGVLIRLFHKQGKMTKPSLRFGLPKNAKQWQQLNETLTSLSTLIVNNKISDEKHYV